MVGRLKGHEVLVPLKTRFSTLRFSKAIKNLTPTQIAHVHKYDLQNLLLICEHFSVPINLLQWVLDHMDYAGVGIFRQKKKVIHLRREMVTQVFGIRSGLEPFPLSTTDPLVEERVQQLRAYYQCGGKDIAIKNIIVLMEKDESEEGFICSFLFLFFTCIFCPTTHNYAYWKFLYGLHDISKIKSYDLASLCIDHLSKEIVKHHEKLLDNRVRTVRRGPEDQTGPDQMFVGGCLLLVAILYMDFLDLKVAARKRKINYSVPRIAHVKNQDFDFVYLVDMKRDPVKKQKLGALPFRDISETPYSTHALMLAEEKWLKLGANAGGIHVNCGESSKSVPAAMPYPSKERVLELMSEVASKHENLWRIAHEKHVSVLLAELRSVVSSCFPESGQCSNQPPDTVQGLVARANVAKDAAPAFPQGIQGSARMSNGDKDVATPSAEGVQSSPSRVVLDQVVTPQRVQDNQSGPSPVSVINIASTTVTKVAPREVEIGDHLGVGIDIAMSYANEDGLPPEDALKLLSEDTLSTLFGVGISYSSELCK